MIKQFLIAFDQLVNTLLMGMADETLSARAWRERDASMGWGIFRKIIDLLFFYQKNHCYGAYLSELERKQLPKDYR